MIVGYFVWGAVALWKVVLVVLQVLADSTHYHLKGQGGQESRRRLLDALFVLQVVGVSLDLWLMGSVEMRQRQAWNLGLLWALTLLIILLSVPKAVLKEQYVPVASEVTDLARFALELDREGTSDGLVRHSSSCS